jgi:D-amino-acid dehydrogenase
MHPNDYQVNPLAPKIWPIAVIGAGIVGACTALQLRLRGFETLLIDPLDELERASFGNAGVISSGSIFPMAGPSIRANIVNYSLGRDPGLRLRYSRLPFVLGWIYSFLQRCNPSDREHVTQLLIGFTQAAWPAHQRLASLLQTKQLLSERGWLRLYRTQQSFDGSQPERDRLRSAQVAITDLSAAQLRELEPCIAPVFAAGSLINDARSVQNPGALLRSVLRAFTDRGGIVVRAKANALFSHLDALQIHAPDLQIRAHRVVVAAGAWSVQLLDPWLKSIGRPNNIRVPFAAERGYHQHFEQQANKPRLTRPIYDVANGLVVTPFVDTYSPSATVRVLSGVELSTPDASPNYAMLDRCIGKARTFIDLEPMAKAPPWMGSRPSTADGLPVIGSIVQDPRVICAFGHGHIGLSTGPLTGELVADLICGEKPAVDLTGFSLQRFAKPPLTGMDA